MRYTFDQFVIDGDRRIRRFHLLIHCEQFTDLGEQLMVVAAGGLQKTFASVRRVLQRSMEQVTHAAGRV